MAKTKRTQRRTTPTATPKSAVTRVTSSGFDLVPTKKRRGKIGNLGDYAKVDFKPWTREPGMRSGELFPSNEKLAELGVPCRAAYGIMLRTREQLIEAHGELDHAIVDQLMGSLAETAEILKGVAHMVETAYLRILVSAVAANERGVKFKGVDEPKRRATRA